MIACTRTAGLLDTNVPCYREHLKDSKAIQEMFIYTMYKIRAKDFGTQRSRSGKKSAEQMVKDTQAMLLPLRSAFGTFPDLECVQVIAASHMVTYATQYENIQDVPHGISGAL